MKSVSVKADITLCYLKNPTYICPNDLFDMQNLQTIVEQAWENRELLKEETTTNAIREVIELLDTGKLRVAEPIEGGWQVNEWVKKAVVMYFPIQKMETLEAGIFEYHDKMLLKRNYAEKGIRPDPAKRDRCHCEEEERDDRAEKNPAPARLRDQRPHQAPIEADEKIFLVREMALRLVRRGTFGQARIFLSPTQDAD